MKQIIRLILSVLLCSSLLLPVLAVPEDLTISGGEIAAGETVYLVVTLNKETTGDTMGIEYSYDKSHLVAEPELCTWSKPGGVRDFGLTGKGVWATKAADTISGSICTLAFRVKNGAEFDKTTVQCTLIVKNGTQQTGTYTASVTLKMACDHELGAWQTDKGTTHSRSCSRCGYSQTAAHNWDTGVVTQDPQNSDQKIRLFTCTDCGATKQEKVTETLPELPNPTIPTEPVPTLPAPTQPSQTEPTRPAQQGTTQPQTSGQSQKPEQTQKPGQSQQDHTGHNHEDYTTLTTVPPDQEILHSPDDGHDHSGEVIYDSQGNIIEILDPEEIQQTHTVDDGHDHSHDEVLVTETKPKTDTAIVVTAVAAVCIVAALFFLKKKKRR